MISMKKVAFATAAVLGLATGAQAATVSFDANMSFNNGTSGVLADSSFASGQPVNVAYDFDANTVTFTSATNQTASADITLGAQVSNVTINGVTGSGYSILGDISSAFGFGTNGTTLIDEDFVAGGSFEDFLATLTNGDNSAGGGTCLFDLPEQSCAFSNVAANFNVTANNNVDVSPVPLPGAVWMLLAGLGGLGVVRSHKKASAAI